MSRATYAHWNANYVDFGCSDAVCSLGFIWSFRNSALNTTTGTRYTFVDSTTLQYRNTIPLQSNRFQSKLLAKFIKQNWKSFAENEIGFCCFRFPYIFFLRFFSIFFAFSTKLNLNERRKSFFIRWIYMAVASLSMLTFLVPAEKFLIYFLLLYISSGKMCRFSLIKKDRISFGNVIKNYFMVHSSRKLPKIQKHTTRDKGIFPPFHVQTKEIKSVKYFFAHWHRHTNR